MILNSSFFNEECYKFDKLMSDYLIVCEREYVKTLKTIDSFKYSLNSSGLPRGYFCPSLIFDIIISNCKRGKLSKKIIPNNKSAYIYGFDIEGKLVFCKKHFYERNIPSLYELIYYEENTTKSFIFQKNPKVIIKGSINCNYDDSGKIQSYIYSYNSFDDNKTSEIYREDYFYQEEQMLVNTYEFYKNNTIAKNLFINKYSFCFDEEHYLKEYIVDNKKYHINLRRKIY